MVSGRERDLREQESAGAGCLKRKRRAALRRPNPQLHARRGCAGESRLTPAPPGLLFLALHAQGLSVTGRFSSFETPPGLQSANHRPNTFLACRAFPSLCSMYDGMPTEAIARARTPLTPGSIRKAILHLRDASATHATFCLVSPVHRLEPKKAHSLHSLPKSFWNNCQP